MNKPGDDLYKELAAKIEEYLNFTDTVTNIPEEGTSERYTWNSRVGYMRFEIRELLKRIS